MAASMAADSSGVGLMAFGLAGFIAMSNTLSLAFRRITTRMFMSRRT